MRFYNDTNEQRLTITWLLSTFHKRNLFIGVKTQVKGSFSCILVRSWSRSELYETSFGLFHGSRQFRVEM